MKDIGAKFKVVLNKVLLALRIIQIVWEFYDQNRQLIEELIREAQEAVAQMKALRKAKSEEVVQQLKTDAGRHMAMKLFARLHANLRGEEGVNLDEKGGLSDPN